MVLIILPSALMGAPFHLQHKLYATGENRKVLCAKILLLHRFENLLNLSSMGLKSPFLFHCLVSSREGFISLKLCLQPESQSGFAIELVEYIVGPRRA